MIAEVDPPKRGRGRPRVDKYLWIDWPMLVAADELYRLGRFHFEPPTAKREIRSASAAIKIVVDRYAACPQDGASSIAIAKRLLGRLRKPTTHQRKLALSGAVRTRKRVHSAKIRA